MSSDPLLEYYRRELDHINDRAPRFARRHPKVAGRLGIHGEGGIQDPHVERLIQAFAFLGARTRRKLDEEFPEIATGLLDLLYPHYLRPIPSMAVVGLHFDPSQAEQREAYPVPAGTRLRSERVRGVACEYRSCYPVELWPIEVADASLDIVSENEGGRAGRSHLDITLRTLAPEMKLSAFAGLKRLRFYIHDESPHNSLALYELLLNAAGAVTAVDPDANGLVGECRVRPVGFRREDALLPEIPRSAPGLPLLLEYFAFPQKFLFVDVELPAAVLAKCGRRLRLRFSLDRAPRRLVPGLSRETFRLGCTPIVNLFERKQPPAYIRVKHKQRDYQVVPDPAEYFGQEVYSVDRVTGVHDGDGPLEEVGYAPLYSLGHDDGAARTTFWHAIRRDNPDEDVAGSDLFLSFVDLDHRPAVAPRTTITVETTCINRELPGELGVRPRFSLLQRGLVSDVECITSPTPTRRPFQDSQSRWRLLSHLALNQRALIAEDGSPDALRELLMLYDVDGSAAGRESIRSIKRVRRSRGVARVRVQGADAFCVGSDVAVHFEPDGFSDHGLFLFASVIDRFLGAMCPINSFTRLSAWRDGEEKASYQWPARSGGRERL